MPRFAMNRQWTFIVVLLGVLAFGLGFSSTSQAGGGSGWFLDDPIQPTNPPGAGDPDVPETPGKHSRGSTVAPEASPGVVAAGDSRSVESLLMMRLRIVLKIWGTAYLRF